MALIPDFKKIAEQMNTASPISITQKVWRDLFATCWNWFAAQLWKIPALLGNGTPADARRLLGLENVTIAYNNRGDWQSNADYDTNDLVWWEGSTYAALVSHHSGNDFMADLNMGLWRPIGGDLYETIMESLGVGQGLPLKNFAALRGYSGTEPTVYVGGRVNYLDGGNGRFVMVDKNAAAAGYTDDDGIYLIDSLGRGWTRSDLPISVRHYGALGDGTDQTAQFLAFALYLQSHIGIPGEIPSGTYMLSQHVYLGCANQVTVGAHASFPGKQVIVSDSPNGHHLETQLTPWPDFKGLDTFRRVPLNFEFHVNQNLNNQGLAYFGGYYYVGYDLGGGNGYLEKYSGNGVLDASYGGVPVPTRHTADLAYRMADGRLYAASGGGSEPTYIYRLAVDGKSVDKTLDYTAYGNSALLAIDNTTDLLVLFTIQTGGDYGDPTFRFVDWNDNNRVVQQFTIPSQGVPQGLDVHDGMIYYYTDNKITVLDYAGNILDIWFINAGGESEGIAVVYEYGAPCIVVGYNDGRRLYSIRSGASLSRFRGIKTLGSWNRGGSSQNVSLSPLEFACAFKKTGAGTDPSYGWALATFLSGNHINIDALNPVPTVTATEISFKFKRSFFMSVAYINGREHYNSPYMARADYDEQSISIRIKLLDYTGAIVNPQTAKDNIVWFEMKGGCRVDNF